uniref:YceI family protein n=2 Tax=Xanthomarina TaxID=1868329 RepID=UPI003511425B
MKLTKHISKGIFFFAILFFSSFSVVQSQEYNLSNSDSELKVYGTSNVHDWEINANEQSGVIDLIYSNELEINKLKIVIPAESLKSGKGGMDKNTYKALKTDKYKNITFSLTEIKSSTRLGDQKYKVKALGNLTISGVTKNVSIDFNLDINSNTIHIVGEKSIKMTDFNVEPPTALFGSITTGDEITIKFKTKF